MISGKVIRAIRREFRALQRRYDRNAAVRSHCYIGRKQLQRIERGDHRPELIVAMCANLASLWRCLSTAARP